MRVRAPRLPHCKHWPEQAQVARFLIETQGWSDCKTARAVGVHQTTVRAWRLKWRLPANYRQVGEGINPRQPIREAA